MVEAAVVAYGRIDQLVVASGMNQPGFIEEMDRRARCSSCPRSAADTATTPATPPTALRKGRSTRSPAASAPSGQIWDHRQRDRPDRLPLQPLRLDVRRRRARHGDPRAQSLAHPDGPA